MEDEFEALSTRFGTKQPLLLFFIGGNIKLLFKYDKLVLLEWGEATVVQFLGVGHHYWTRRLVIVFASVKVCGLLANIFEEKATYFMFPTIPTFPNIANIVNIANIANMANIQNIQKHSKHFKYSKYSKHSKHSKHYKH